MTTPLTVASALTWAIDTLDLEEHRYVERFGPCPNGCEFAYVTAALTDDDRPIPLPHPILARTAGPPDCDQCDDGTVEDENAPGVDPYLDVLRAHLQALNKATLNEATP